MEGLLISYANISKGSTEDFLTPATLNDPRLTAKIDFLVGREMLLLLMLTLKVLKSLYTLFDKYMDHMQVKIEQTCMIKTVIFF